VFSKACQYGIKTEKVDKSFKYVSIKVVQSNLQKCIPWPKKSKNNKQEWNKAYIGFGICPRKLNTLVKIN
jgi:hypothetical protein